MGDQPLILMTDPAHFDVCYEINPWMQPTAWRQDPEACQRRAAMGWTQLKSALERAGAKVTVLPGEAGLPDMVFPANAATVLDGRALMARFHCPERQGEEPHFRAAFESLRRRGLLDEVATLPPGYAHEGAGDALWDVSRKLFWVGYGQRSVKGAAKVIGDFFGQETVALQLATPRFYHLDTCFRPLEGGEVLYYPPAFTPESLALIHERVAPELRLEADDADAAAFCVNAVNIGRKIVMAQPPAALRERLEARGYEVVEVDLSPFILSGGAAFCMTLRLDHRSDAAGQAVAA